MKRKNAWLMPLICMVTLMFGQGCGVYMAFTQPDPVSYEWLNPGQAQRGMVMSVLGTPVESISTEDGGRVDTYRFYEGTSTGWSAGRAMLHMMADLFTLGLWEIVATPTEFAIRGDKITTQAVFDSKDVLRKFTVIKREEKPLEKIHEEEW